MPHERASEQGQTEGTLEDAIRQIGRMLAIASASLDRGHFSEVAVQIDRLTAGQDPDKIDWDSPEVRAGASLALAATLNGLWELVPTPEIRYDRAENPTRRH